MKMISLGTRLLLAVTILVTAVSSACADLDATQRRELGKIKQVLAKVSSQIRRKDFDEAEQGIQDAEARLKKIVEDAQVPDTDKPIADLQKLIDLRRNSLEQRKSGKPARAKKGVVSFSKHVAPILNANCVKCHANNPKGELRLDTYAGMESGGTSGRLLTAGRPDRSLIMQRLTRTVGNKQQMPRMADPLKGDQLQIIAKWIQQGAKFDGKDKNTRLADLGKPEKKEIPLVLPKATGSETVSFKDDIAPTMVNLCIRCHNERQNNNGLILTSFESIMRGGDNGRVIIPGNLEGSLLWQRVGGGEQPRMPQGQARITRTFFNNLRTWFEEGNKYDGGDPQTPLRTLVPTDEARKLAELAALTPEEFAQMRLGQGEEMYKKVVTQGGTKYIQNAEVFVFGDVSDERLTQVKDWADAYAAELRKQFNIKTPPVWKGKLIIFVLKDRFGYAEFNKVIESREVPSSVTGHSVVTPRTYEQAYVALQDVGDEASEANAGLQTNLIDHMTGAFLQRNGAKMPAWVLRGTGLAFASQSDPGNEYLFALRKQALDELKSVGNPADIFADGTFSPGGVAAVGYTLVEYMLRQGGASRFGRFIGTLEKGGSVAAGIKSVYRADTKQLAVSYYKNLQRTRGKRK
ncbi:MAG: hypothetical protein CMJ48_00370 [Planctomycetaceae bacterium]|nr:hypothetical protein [Planctomycetaceae bacterium]